MKRIVSIIEAALMLTVIPVCGLSQSATEPASQSTITIKIDPAQNPVHLGATVILKVAVTNNSSDAFMIVAGSPVRSRYKIDIRDKSGKKVKETEAGCKLHKSENCDTSSPSVRRGASVDFRLAPKAEADNELDVSHEYIFDHPGTYEISIRMLNVSLFVTPQGSAATWRDFYALQQDARKEEKIDEIRSNTIQIDVVQ
jgi:hypothetical protein